MTKVYEVAAECGVDVSDVLQELTAMGEYVKSGSSSLPAPLVKKLRERLLNLPNSNPIKNAQSVEPKEALASANVVDSAPNEAGQLVLGKYELLETKSEGGLAVVYRALDRQARPERFVAVKVLEPQEDAVITQSLYEHEIKSLKKLQGSPNIVTLLDQGFDKRLQKFCIVLEWLDKTLDNYLRESGAVVDPNLWIKISSQMLRAVELAHKRGIEHRDLKPSNIMIRSVNGGIPEIALIDFGIAKQHQDATEALKTVAGFRTPIYSPSDFATSNDYVRDVYGLAVIMLRLLQDDEFTDSASVGMALRGLEKMGQAFAAFRGPLSSVLHPVAGKEVVSVSAFREMLVDAQFSEGNFRKQELCLLIRPKTLLQAQTDIGDEFSINWLESTLNSGPTFVTFRHDQGKIDPTRVSLTVDDIQIRCALEDNGARQYLHVISVSAVSASQAENQHRFGLALDLRFFRVTLSEEPFAIPQNATLVRFLKKYRPDSANPRPESLITDRFTRWSKVLEARKDFVLNHAKPVKYDQLHRLGREVSLEIENLEQPPPLLSSWVVEGFPRVTLELVAIEDSSAYFSADGQLPNYPKSGKLTPSLGRNAPSLRRQQDAVIRLSDPTISSSRIAEVISNPSEATLTPLDEKLQFVSSNLDDDKKAAVELALKSNDICVVQGPPGTGKTTFIAELIQQFLALYAGEKKRVLLVSQTHVAVDNALERLEKSGMDSLLRVGLEKKVSERTAHLLLSRKIQKWADQAQKKSKRKLLDLLNEKGFDFGEVDKLSIYLDLIESLKNSKPSRRLAEDALKTSIQEQLASEYDDVSADFDTDTMDLIGKLETYGISAQERSSLTNPLYLIQKVKSAFNLSTGLEQATELVRLQKSWNLKFPHDSELQRRVAEESKVIAGTCVGFLSDRNVRDMEFDLCIVDEASKATATELLVPLSKSARAVLVGDSKQLPAMDDEMIRDPDFLKKHDLTPEIVRRSLFEELSEDLPKQSKTMLSTQYRMAPAIGNLISNIYYDGRLISHPRPEIPGYSALIGRRVMWYDTSTLRVHEEAQAGKSFVNQAEVKAIGKKVQELLTVLEVTKFYSPSQPPEILVIAPYQAQVTRLKQELAQRRLTSANVRVETFDAVQGLESDFVFVSLTRSNKTRNFGFIGSSYWRRHNVALSRAREGLFIFGDREFVASGKKGLGDVLKYLETNPADCEIRHLND